MQARLKMRIVQNKNEIMIATNVNVKMIICGLYVYEIVSVIKNGKSVSTQILKIDHAKNVFSINRISI